MKTRILKCGLYFVVLLGNIAQAQIPQPPLIMAPVTPLRDAELAPLQALVRQALDRSPGIREAQANARAAEQDVKQSRGALLPKLEFNANSTALSGANSTNAVGGRLYSTVSYNVYDFGRIRSQIEARQFQSMTTQHQVRLAREDTAFMTVMAYLQLIKYQRLTTIYEQHIVNLGELSGKLAEIVAVVPGRRSELTQAQSRLGQARDALTTLQARRREFQLTLLRQTGSATAPALPEAAPSFPVTSIMQMLEAARLTHPAVSAARDEANAARAQASEAQAATLPQTDLLLTRAAGRDANGFTSPMQLYLSAKWVAFDGFGARSSVQALKEKAQAADERAQQLLDEIEFNLRSASSDYETQSARARELPKLVQGTDQVRKDTFDQWRELGRRSLLEVLTAENEHLDAQIALATSNVDQMIALARMRHEAGQLKEWLVGDEGYSVPAMVSQATILERP